MVTRYWTGDSTNSGRFGDAANWSDDTAPGSWGTADIVFMSDSDENLTTGLTQTSVTIAELHIMQSWTGQFSDYLKINAGVLVIGEHNGANSPAGSPKLMVDLRSAADPMIYVYNTSASSTDANKPPVRLLANDTDAEAYITRGIVGIGANNPGEAATLGKIDVSFDQQPQFDAQVIVGDNVQLTTFDARGGQNRLDSAPTNVYVDDGTTVISADGTVATLKVRGDVEITGNATITNPVELYAGGSLKLDRERVTLSNGVDLMRCGIQDVTLDLGAHLTITPSAID